nr:DUF2281 domain-containing protein [Anaerolineae bacterium]
MGEMKTLTRLIYKLPPETRQEVRDFVEFLLFKRKPRLSRKPKLKWKGALKDLRDQYTSVTLQHAALEWWVG